jgi:1,4-alpha-glucan branching enzyme
MATKKRTVRKSTSGTVQQPFTIKAPAALRVLLAGDFTLWQANAIPMKKGADGLWHTEVELAPGTYHYRFIVDGEWQNDPECTLHVPNVYGTTNSVREVR